MSKLCQNEDDNNGNPIKKQKFDLDNFRKDVASKMIKISIHDTIDYAHDMKWSKFKSKINKAECNKLVIDKINTLNKDKLSSLNEWIDKHNDNKKEESLRKRKRTKIINSIYEKRKEIDARLHPKQRLNQYMMWQLSTVVPVIITTCTDSRWWIGPEHNDPSMYVMNTGELDELRFFSVHEYPAARDWKYPLYYKYFWCKLKSTKLEVINSGYCDGKTGKVDKVGIVLDPLKPIDISVEERAPELLGKVCKTSPGGKTPKDRKVSHRVKFKYYGQIYNDISKHKDGGYIRFTILPELYMPFTICLNILKLPLEICKIILSHLRYFSNSI